MSEFNHTIAFIGAGNMAKSFIKGLIGKGYPSSKICVCAPRREELLALENAFSIRISDDNIAFIANADILILAVKPQVIKTVCLEIGEHLSDKALIVSLAAGINSESIDKWLGGKRAIVRCMSNTPAQILMGASGLFANAAVSVQQHNLATSVVEAIGIVCWVDNESLIDSVTAIAGSGPAYFFLFLEAMIDTAVAQGMPREDATRLAIQTALGAAALARKSNDNLIELRKKVTSPKGTTERAIAAFEHDQLRTIVANAMNACVQRARELGAQNQEL